jgi:hypothetical protein
MKFVSSTITRFVMGLAFACLAACGDSDVADNTAAEASRETRIKSLAAKACDRYESCTGYGTGSNQPYTSEAECEADFTTKAGTLWPEDKCNRRQINDARYDACVNSAQAVACGGSILDTIAALDDCNSAKVCTDPPQ